MPAANMWDPQAKLNADPYGFAGRGAASGVGGQPPPFASAPRLPGRPGTGSSFGDMLRRRLVQKAGGGQGPGADKSYQGQDPFTATWFNNPGVNQGQGGGGFNIWDMGGDATHGFDPFVNATGGAYGGK